MPKSWEEMTEEEKKASYDALTTSNEDLNKKFEVVIGERDQARNHAVEEKKKYTALYNEVFTSKPEPTKPTKPEPTAVKTLDEIGIK